jgi:photosystem II stability/assembly factor-like uncharacterized protein
MNRFFVFLILALRLQAFGGGFYSVHSPNGVDVWAVGDTGRVYHSLDAGANWGAVPQGTQTLRSVFTMNASIWIVGDGGVYYRSTDGGASWAPQTLNGGARLNAIAFASPMRGWAVGNSGSIITTTDGGSSWSSQSSGISQSLYALSFVDTLTGYACGAAGKLLKTTNGGTTWSSAGDVAWTKDILSVSAKGGVVYVAGADGFCYQSTGAARLEQVWGSLNFKTDSKSDVNDVFAIAADTAIFTGGGGFIRRSVDAGQSFVWGVHEMYAKINDVYFYNGSNGWACSEKNYAVLRTTDGGLTWSLPVGTVVGYSWVLKQTAGSNRGNSFAIDPWNKNRIFAAIANVIYMSADRGDTWAAVPGKTGGGGMQWSFYISPRDSNKWIVACNFNQVRRSTNAGVTWTTINVGIGTNFTSYGMPIEMDPDHPDTLFYIPEGTGGGGDSANAWRYRSTNFGLTWPDSLATNFRSPCDIVVVPDSTNIMYVADGITGNGTAQMWRSTNSGTTWTSIYPAGSSEIPMIAISRLRKNQAFATAWSSTSVTRTTNQGASWTNIASTTATWGADVAKDDPNVFMYGQYSGSHTFLSNNAGSSFPVSSSLTGSNSGMLVCDRATFLVYQSSGSIYKYVVTYTVPVTSIQAVNVVSPNGGESWQYNSYHNITWTASNFANVKIDYKTFPGGAWQTIVASIPSASGSYSWLVPNAPTLQARVRISDALDTNPLDSTDGVFSITVPGITSLPTLMNFGSVAVGSSTSDTIRLYNTGNATLVISSAMAGNANFAAGRTSFSIPPGSSDTLSVLFSPSALLNYQDTLRLNNNSPGAVFKVPLSGLGVSAISSLMKMRLHDNGGELDSLEYGIGVGATDGIDASFGEYELPPVPPVGVLDVRWQIAGTQGTERDIRDTLGGTRQQVIYTGQLQAGGGGYPFVLKWSRQELPTGTFTLRDGNGGTYFTVNMKQQDSLVISDDQIQVFQIVYDAGNVVYAAVQQNWNIVSLPVTQDDRRKTVVFPTSVSNAFAYTPTGYASRDTLDYGLGYWLKFSSTQALSLTGGEITSDTIDVLQGWNIIGSISSPVAVGSIIQIPGGIVTSQYFGYTGGTYAFTSSIEPMKAYWVKVNQNGKLVLSGPAARSQKSHGDHPEYTGR